MQLSIALKFLPDSERLKCELDSHFFVLSPLSLGIGPRALTATSKK